MRLNQRIRGLIAGMIVSIVSVSGCSGPSEIAVTSFGRSEEIAEVEPSGYEQSKHAEDEDSAGSIIPEGTADSDDLKGTADSDDLKGTSDSDHLEGTADLESLEGTAGDDGESSAASDDADSVSSGQSKSGTQAGLAEEADSSGEEQIHDGQEETQMLAVYVCGAVQEPDVYYLPVGARIYDALQAAGGFTEDADSQWLNQAQPLTDGQMLLVYTAQETAQMELEGAKRGENASGTVSSASGSGGAAGSGSTSTDSSVVNLNTGTKEQLMTLPGIGESKADAIIRYRTETGMFGCVEDIMNISGIKNSTFEKIKDRITV